MIRLTTQDGWTRFFKYADDAREFLRQRAGETQ